jgi:hypothetical protein
MGNTFPCLLRPEHRPAEQPTVSFERHIELALVKENDDLGRRGTNAVGKFPRARGSRESLTSSKDGVLE